MRPGSLDSLLGMMPGSSNVTFGTQPGRDDMLLGRIGGGAARADIDHDAGRHLSRASGQPDHRSASTDSGGTAFLYGTLELPKTEGDEDRADRPDTRSGRRSLGAAKPRHPGQVPRDSAGARDVLTASLRAIRSSMPTVSLCLMVPTRCDGPMALHNTT